MFENREVSEISGRQCRSRSGWRRPVAILPTRTSLRSQTPTYYLRRSRTMLFYPKTAAEVLEGRAVTKGNSEEYACDLYPETGANIEWT
jgi:hypothetical protein